ncbi:juvenile hormone esterase-like [Venturia canescens]|uniref:juvenile hormone esterase-like n=1 Tax=Venturia canescens TaxID=32260 RepID=UPI001C9C049D|nr:juvenile hormone esterase-like [Venturia canescens]
MASRQKCLRSVHFFVLISCLSFVENKSVTIEQGDLRGNTLTSRGGRNFTAFRGIPYAQPPINKLRFKNPVPADSWNGTFVADEEGNRCPQLNVSSGEAFGNEDCLYLNVYTPKTNPVTLYPTIVYIHGGAFTRGHGGADYVGPQYIMDKDIVFVSMNYRLGALGFLSTGDAAAPGNFGLKDQLLALRWVNENVKAFGGDPQRITLAGQSAGSVSVNLHALSEASIGLFNQYITQSGSPLSFWAYRDISSHKKYASDLGKHVGCPTNDSEVLIECLRRIEVYDLLTTEIFSGISTEFNTWVPTNEPPLEGAFITESPIELLLGNKLRDYPWISGNVADEGLILSAHLYVHEDFYDFVAKDVVKFLQYLTITFIDTNNSTTLGTDIAEFYLKNVDLSNKDALIQALTRIVNDVGFLLPAIIQMQIALNRMKSPFYYYLFEYRGTNSETERTLHENRDIGVAHGDELFYIFPPTKTNLASGGGMVHLDETMINIMTDLWSSFAYNGVPVTKHMHETNTWKPFDQEMTYLGIGGRNHTMLTVGKNLQHERMRFWIKQLFKYAFHMFTKKNNK